MFEHLAQQDQGNASNEEEEKGGRESKHMRVEDYEEENEDLVDEEEGRVLKKMRVVKDEGEGEIEGKEKRSNTGVSNTFKDIKNGASTSSNTLRVPKRIDTGVLSKIPPELLHHILKFLSSEVL